MKLRYFCLICLLVVAMLALAGCGWVENLKLFKGGEEEPAPAPEEGAVQQPLKVGTDAVDPNAEAAPEEQPDQAAAPIPDGSGRQIVLYFASSDGRTLEAETRDIPKQEGIARATVNQLIAGPKDDSLSPTLPANTILDDINISNGVCTVDFSSEFLEQLPADTNSQLLALYSVVNTLTQFDTVEYVRILVDGKSLSATIGGVDVSETLAPVQF